MTKFLGLTAAFMVRLFQLPRLGPVHLRSWFNFAYTFPDGRHVFHDTGFAFA